MNFNLPWQLAPLILAHAATLASAQPERPTTAVIAMPVSAAKEPVPALVWRLLPELRDTTAGNAVVLYYRAFNPEWLAPLRRETRVVDAVNKAVQSPLSDFRDRNLEATRLIEWVRDSSMLKEVDRAARRQHCDWELTNRVREDGLGTMIPDIQWFRSFAQLLVVRARFELADGQFRKAERSLQSALSMARHVSDAPTLIQSLVAAAIASLTLDQVEEWIRTPDSPNLYWALTNLPQPFIDMRKPFEGERLIIDNLLPGYRDALANRTAVPVTLNEAKELQSKIAMLPNSGGPLLIFQIVVKGYADAKAFLRENGWPEALIAGQPTVQAVLLHQVAEYDRLFDEFVKWLGLPFADARAGLERAEAALNEHMASVGRDMSLASLLLPATHRVLQASNRIDRRIAGLRCLEAIRLHAARHGRLPAALAEIKDVPVPHNPSTGQPFEYTSDRAKATLLIPSPAPANSIKYEITVRK